MHKQSCSHAFLCLCSERKSLVSCKDQLGCGVVLKMMILSIVGIQVAMTGIFIVLAITVHFNFLEVTPSNSCLFKERQNRTWACKTVPAHRRATWNSPKCSVLSTFCSKLKKNKYSVWLFLSFCIIDAHIWKSEAKASAGGNISPFLSYPALNGWWLHIRVLKNCYCRLYIALCVL